MPIGLVARRAAGRCARARRRSIAARACPPRSPRRHLRLCRRHGDHGLILAPRAALSISPPAMLVELLLERIDRAAFCIFARISIPARARPAGFSLTSGFVISGICGRDLDDPGLRVCRSARGVGTTGAVLEAGIWRVRVFLDLRNDHRALHARRDGAETFVLRCSQSFRAS